MMVGAVEKFGSNPVFGLWGRQSCEMKGLPMPLLVSLLHMGGKVQKFLRKAA